MFFSTLYLFGELLGFYFLAVLIFLNMLYFIQKIKIKKLFFIIFNNLFYYFLFSFFILLKVQAPRFFLF